MVRTPIYTEVKRKDDRDIDDEDDDHNFDHQLAMTDDEEEGGGGGGGEDEQTARIPPHFSPRSDNTSIRRRAFVIGCTSFVVGCLVGGTLVTIFGGGDWSIAVGSHGDGGASSNLLAGCSNQITTSSVMGDSSNEQIISGAVTMATIHTSFTGSSAVAQNEVEEGNNSVDETLQMKKAVITDNFLVLEQVVHDHTSFT